MKEKIVKLLLKFVDLDVSVIEGLLETPPHSDMGDFAFPCFVLAKELKMAPVKIAEDLVSKIEKKLPKEISNVVAVGPYVNFFVDKKILVEKLLSNAGCENFGANDFGEGKKIVLDMSSPNIAKPFGIGHLRSTIIGDSIARIAKMNGYETIKINYLGDWGTQFGKLILAFKKWGDRKKLEDDAIAHLQELYVRVNADESLEDEARAEFKKLEDGDAENLKLWKEFRELSIKKFDELYKLLGVEFDVISGESEYNEKMDSVIKELKKKKLLVDSEGAKVVDLSSQNKGIVLIQKSDGTGLYATRDLASMTDRYKRFKFDKMLFEVGSEQKLHFQQVFAILKLMGYAWADDCVHVAHGLYLAEDGKKFSTRQGKTVYMTDLLDEAIKKAKKNLKEKSTGLSASELKKRALAIALAAIKYGDLKNYRENNIVFDVDRFLSFDGDTGPYLLYSYARASSIVRKVKSKKGFKISKLEDAEVELVKKIAEFPNVVQKACEQLSPNLVANYCYDLSKAFNEFYHSCPVMGAESEGFRLKLVDVFRNTLKSGLGLLGIGVLEEM